MNDRVVIEGLTVFATIGAYDWEQTIKQKLVLDLEMAWDNKPAANTDDVNYCLDYAAVSHTICDYIEKQPFKLIERVAEEIATLVINQFSVAKVNVKVSKPGAVANAKSVGVVIERTK